MEVIRMDEQQKVSILIVDDDTVYLDVLRDLLQDKYAIHVAQTGPSAIVLAEDVKPDIILLDVVIPGMTGYEVFSALQENVTTRHIPVIFISGLTDLEEQEKGFVLGAADYVQKPCSKLVLHAKIDTQLKIVELAQLINQIGLMDPLTGLPNKKRFYYRTGEEWRRNCRNQTPISMLCIDIDNFKDFNQEYGYLLGDEAIKAVASICKNAIHRSGDTAAAYGGGSFRLLLPGTDAAGARTVAEYIRKTAEKQEISSPDSDKTVKLTVSIGVASIAPQKDDLTGNSEKIVEEFMNAAFDKLREAKTAGKNRIAYA
jgi:diguanylate cyclase (GGDEF)-like protein